jgi:hypothetical protein
MGWTFRNIVLGAFASGFFLVIMVELCLLSISISIGTSQLLDLTDLPPIMKGIIWFLITIYVPGKIFDPIFHIQVKLVDTIFPYIGRFCDVISYSDPEFGIDLDDEEGEEQMDVKRPLQMTNVGSIVHV